MSNKGHPGVQGPVGYQAGDDDRIDPAIDLNKNQIKQMVEDAMAGQDFDAVLDTYFKEIEDRITGEIQRANAEQEDACGGGYNLSSEAGCRFLAEKIVNNVLRPPIKGDTNGEEV